MKRKACTAALLVLGVALSAAGPVIADDDSPRYTIDDVTACSPDAMRLCKDKLGDIDAIEACMKSHYADLRPKCQARFRH